MVTGEFKEERQAKRVCLMNGWREGDPNRDYNVAPREAKVDDLARLESLPASEIT